MKDEKLNATVCTFEQLWSEIGASTKFGLDELVRMISVQDDDKKDFYIHHREKTFVVRKESIREYFQTHTKPVPPMNAKQELIYLREKVKKLEAEAMARIGEAKPAPEEKVDAPAPVDDGQDLPPIEEKVAIPPRDERIPPPEERKKKSLKEIQKDLAVELKDKKGAKQKLGDTAVPKEIDRAPSA